MQQTGSLIEPHPLSLMPQRSGNYRAHAGRSHGVGSIIPANETTWPTRVRIIIEAHQSSHQRARNQQRSRWWTRGHEGNWRKVATYSHTVRPVRISFSERACQGELD